ncbi:acyltransferase [uncultured Tenacibaculum sp.]|uniref:acyltransferase family protein n=1 Tax=uncultured Tenacibaculum sp. TaxID=174713 RepID=UPI002624EA44|nr:acyltransferase [uncultured Tenacibaculum sp.]
MQVSEFLIRKNNNLDLMRVILAIMVIVGHCIALNGDTKNWVDPIQYFFKYTHSGSLAVKLFFVISGLVVTNSYLSKRDDFYFVVSRFFRIIPLLFFILFFTVFLLGPFLSTSSFNEYISHPNTLSYLWKNLIFDTQYYLKGVFLNNIYPNAVNGSLWSLRYEIACYIVLFSSFLILGKRDKKLLNIPVLLIIIDSILPKSFLFGFLGANVDINLTPFSFALGVFLAINSKKISITINTVLSFGLLYFVFKTSYINHTLLIIFFSVLLIYLSSNKHILKIRLKYDVSYGIYLWGFLVQQTLFYYLGTIYAGLHCLIAILISGALAILTYIIIEKPFMEYGKKFYKIYNNKK